jgi:hypothetical protein
MSEIVTLEELGNYLGRGVPDGNRDDQIRGMVNGWLDTACNRVFTAAEYTEKYSVMDSYRRALLVKNPPIRSVTQITSGRTNATVVDSSAYVVEDAEAGIILFTTEWLLVGVQQYVVTYQGGFVSPPSDLKLMALSVIARESEKAEKGRHGMRGRSFAQGSVEFFIDGLTNLEKMILGSYTIRRFD